MLAVCRAGSKVTEVLEQQAGPDPSAPDDGIGASQITVNNSHRAQTPYSRLNGQIQIFRPPGQVVRTRVNNEGSLNLSTRNPLRGRVFTAEMVRRICLPHTSPSRATRRS
jgi:hypothetical protein